MVTPQSPYHEALHSTNVSITQLKRFQSTVAQSRLKTVETAKGQEPTVPETLKPTTP